MTPATWQADGVCADSISIMLRHLARTNEELQNVNANLRLHSQIALGSIGSMALSAGCFAIAASIDPPENTHTITHTGPNGYYHVDDPMKRYENTVTGLTVAGIAFGVAGCIGIITSYFPTLNGKIKCDGKRLRMMIL